jgi:hypothetical protein
MRGLAVTALVTLLVSCGHDQEAWMQIPGKPVTLYYKEQRPPCAGVSPYLNAAAAHIASYLQVPLPKAIPYYFTDKVAGACGSNHAWGCSRDIPVSIWATYPTSVHELVHAIRIGHSGYAPSLLMEGEAVALGDSWTNAGPSLDVSDETLLPAQHLHGDLYGTAGDLVSYLLVRAGPAPFHTLVRALPFSSTAEQVQAAFTTVYGKSLSDLRRDRAADAVRFPQNRLWLPECWMGEAPALPAEGKLFDEALSCATNALGPNGLRMSRWYSFQVESEGLYSVAPQIATQTRVALYRCTAGPLVEYGSGGQLRDEPAQIVAHLPAGRYALNLNAPLAMDPAPFNVGLHPTPQGAAPAPCAPGTPQVTVASDTRNFFLMGMGARSFEVAFRVDRPRRAAGLVIDLSTASGGATICSPACSSDCTQASALRSMPLSPTSSYSVRASFDGSGRPAGLAFE